MKTAKSNELRRFGPPQTQRVRGVGAVTEDRRVVRHADHDLLRQPAHAETPVLVDERFGTPAELHFDRPLGSWDVPRRAEPQPVVGALDLPAIDDLLVEDAELIADAVAQRRNLERGHRIQKACGQPSEPPVAEPRLLFLLQQLVEVQAELADGGLDLIVDAEVDQVVAQLRAD